MSNELSEMRLKNKEIFTKMYWKEHKDYVRHSFKATIDHARDHIFTRETVSQFPLSLTGNYRLLNLRIQIN